MSKEFKQTKNILLLLHYILQLIHYSITKWPEHTLSLFIIMFENDTQLFQGYWPRVFVTSVLCVIIHRN